MANRKRIEDMIKYRKLGDASRSDMLSFLTHEGFYDASGGKGGHMKLKKDDGKTIILPSGRTLRKDQIRYILKEANYL